MKKALKAKWLKALRSGRYEQATGKLKSTDGGYCCLGVLCNVMGAKWKLDDDAELKPYFDGRPIGVDDEFFLRPAFLKKVGLTDVRQKELADLNDGKPGLNILPSSFSEIADHIEKVVRAT